MAAVQQPRLLVLVLLCIISSASARELGWSSAADVVSTIQADSLPNVANNDAVGTRHLEQRLARGDPAALNSNNLSNDDDDDFNNVVPTYARPILPSQTPPTLDQLYNPVVEAEQKTKHNKHDNGEALVNHINRRQRPYALPAYNSNGGDDDDDQNGNSEAASNSRYNKRRRQAKSKRRASKNRPALSPEGGWSADSVGGGDWTASTTTTAPPDVLLYRPKPPQRKQLWQNDDDDERLQKLSSSKASRVNIIKFAESVAPYDAFALLPGASVLKDSPNRNRHRQSLLFGGEDDAESESSMQKSSSAADDNSAQKLSTPMRQTSFSGLVEVPYASVFRTSASNGKRQGGGQEAATTSQYSPTGQRPTAEQAATLFRGEQQAPPNAEQQQQQQEDEDGNQEQQKPQYYIKVNKQAGPVRWQQQQQQQTVGDGRRSQAATQQNAFVYQPQAGEAEQDDYVVLQPPAKQYWQKRPAAVNQQQREAAEPITQKEYAALTNWPAPTQTAAQGQTGYSQPLPSPTNNYYNEPATDNSPEQVTDAEPPNIAKPSRASPYASPVPYYSAPASVPSAQQQPLSYAYAAADNGGFSLPPPPPEQQWTEEVVQASEPAVVNHQYRVENVVDYRPAPYTAKPPSVRRPLRRLPQRRRPNYPPSKVSSYVDDAASLAGALSRYPSVQPPPKHPSEKQLRRKRLQNDAASRFHGLKA